MAFFFLLVLLLVRRTFVCVLPSKKGRTGRVGRLLFPRSSELRKLLVSWPPLKVKVAV
jgi:hypothetical protein